MSFNFASYQSASGCNSTTYIQGSKALAAYLEDWYEYQWSMGIYNCRPPRGGSGYSHHAEARAYDSGVPSVSATVPEREKGMAIVNLLGPHGARLGIDHIIYARTIWSRVNPGGKYYTGVHPHNDHAHIGLTRTAGANLNYATLVAVAGDPKQSSVGGYNVYPIGPGFNENKADVIAVQDILNKAYGLSLTEDGIWGPATAEATKTHTGHFTGDPNAKDGKYFVANQMSGAEGAWMDKKIAAALAGVGGGTVDQVARNKADAAMTTATSAQSVAVSARSIAVGADAGSKKALATLAAIDEAINP